MRCSHGRIVQAVCTNFWPKAMYKLLDQFARVERSRLRPARQAKRRPKSLGRAASTEFADSHCCDSDYESPRLQPFSAYCRSNSIGDSPQATGISMSRHFHSKGIECYCHPHYFEKGATKKDKAKRDEAPGGEAKKDDAKRAQLDASPTTASGSGAAAAGTPADPKVATKPAKTKSGVWSGGPLITFFSRFSVAGKTSESADA